MRGVKDVLELQMPKSCDFSPWKSVEFDAIFESSMFHHNIVVSYVECRSI